MTPPTSPDRRRHRGRRERLTTAAVATALLMALTGCSVVTTLGSAENEASLSQSLATLEDELADIPGISRTSSALAMNAEYTFAVGLTAETDGDLDEDSAQEVVAAVTRVFSDGAFSAQPSLQFQLVEGVENLITVDYAGFPADVIPAEVGYLYDVKDVYDGSVGLSLYPPDPSSGTAFARTISASSADAALAPVDWVALRAIPDASGANRGWEFPGVSAVGALPPQRLDTFTAQLNPTAESIQWIESSDWLSLNIVPPELRTGGDFTDLDGWDRTVTLVSEAQLLGLRTLSIAEDGSNVEAHFGDCPAAQTYARSEQLVAALAAEGIVAEPGGCYPG